MKRCQSVRIFINRQPFEFSEPRQTGLSIKKHADIPVCSILYTRDRTQSDYYQDNQKLRRDEIENDEVVHLRNGQHFGVIEVNQAVTVKINLKAYEFCDPHITGRELKEVAGIELTDVLFRNQLDEDEVIPSDTKIKLESGDCFYSAPPANYGEINFSPEDVGSGQFECLPQSNGWTLLRVLGFQLPGGYNEEQVNLLLKIPPGFPDAAPDMFWVTPHLKTASGAVPQGTTYESILGEQWQRFSWHLKPGAWRPGISTLRDFMRCVYARFDKRN